MAIFTFDGVESVDSGIVDSRIRLAPDLNFFENTDGNLGNQLRITGIDSSGGLTTALSLTGKYAISSIGFQGLTSETVTVEMTIDGVVIFNDTFTSATSLSVLNSVSGTSIGTNNPATVGPVICESSLLLRIQTATASNLTLNYLVRPIL